MSPICCICKEKGLQITLWGGFEDHSLQNVLKLRITSTFAHKTASGGSLRIILSKTWRTIYLDLEWYKFWMTNICICANYEGKYIPVWYNRWTKFVVFPCLIQLRVTVMMILCIHLMYSHDFDIIEWFYDENGSFEVKLRVISWVGWYPDDKCCHQLTSYRKSWWFFEAYTHVIPCLWHYIYYCR